MNHKSGFLNINKPPDFSSHDVVAYLRKLLNIKKVGHGGTLDPFATGVLVIGINDAPRLFEFIQSDKTYIGEITFGIETNTDDTTGEIKNKSEKLPTLDDIKNKINLFKGKILQKPPIFSAVKIDGERAYKLARKESIELSEMKEKEVEIYDTEIISYEQPKLTLKIHCSAGTYIRSIARDLGKALDTYGSLSSLQRIKSGMFTIEESIDLKSAEKSTLDRILISHEKALNLDRLYLDSKQITEILHGREINLKDYKQSKTKHLQLLDNNDKLIAIGCQTANNSIRPIKVLYKNEQTA